MHGKDHGYRINNNRNIKGTGDEHCYDKITEKVKVDVPTFGST